MSDKILDDIFIDFDVTSASIFVSGLANGADIDDELLSRVGIAEFVIEAFDVLVFKIFRDHAGSVAMSHKETFFEGCKDLLEFVVGSIVDIFAENVFNCWVAWRTVDEIEAVGLELEAHVLDEVEAFFDLVRLSFT